METWTTIADTVVGGLTLFAILLGGAIGYARYLRGRISHAKLDLDVIVELYHLGDVDALKIATSIKNDGNCRIAFPHQRDGAANTGVRLSRPTLGAGLPVSRAPPWKLLLSEDLGAIEDDGMDGDQEEGSDDTESALPAPVITELPELEPGQRISRQVLLPGKPAKSGPVGFRIRLYVEGKPRYFRKLKDHPPWSTERVIEVNPRG